MKFKIISIGKIKNKSILSEINELKKRISRLEIIELKEIKDKNEEIIKRKEFELIKTKIKKDELNILLFEHTNQYSTKEFYEKFKNETRTITFIVTGAFGGNNDLKNLIKNHLSLSKMTFTHEFAQLILIEQLYRFECFEKNIPYTK